MSLLVFSRAAGYYHNSIPTAIETIRSFGYNATFTEDPAYFSPNLTQYQAVVFLHNTDEILDTPEQKDSLENYLVQGGGLVGIHSATAALLSTPFYGQAFGAFFDRHPEVQNATFEVTNASHPSTATLPTSWNFEEEIYNFKSDPRDANVSVLLTVNPDSYQDSGKQASAALQGIPHPIAWYRESSIDLGNGTNTNGMNATNGTVIQEGNFTANGRMWYTSLGHTTAIWSDPLFQQHIRGGIDWVLNISNETSTPVANGTAQSGVGAAAASEMDQPGKAELTSRASLATLGGLLISSVLFSVLC